MTSKFIHLRQFALNASCFYTYQRNELSANVYVMQDLTCVFSDVSVFT